MSASLCVRQVLQPALAKVCLSTNDAVGLCCLSLQGASTWGTRSGWLQGHYRAIATLPSQTALKAAEQPLNSSACLSPPAECASSVTSCLYAQGVAAAHRAAGLAGTPAGAHRLSGSSTPAAVRRSETQAGEVAQASVWLICTADLLRAQDLGLLKHLGIHRPGLQQPLQGTACSYAMSSECWNGGPTTAAPASQDRKPTDLVKRGINIQGGHHSPVQ